MGTGSGETSTRMKSGLLKFVVGAAALCGLAALLLLHVLGWLGAARHHASAALLHERGRTTLGVAAAATSATTALVLVLVAGVDAGANDQD